DTGMKVHVAGENDTVDIYRWMGHIKIIDMAGIAPIEVAHMLNADPRYCVRDGGPFPVRIVWAQSKGNSGFFTRGDSKIKTPRDIKPGIRICRMTYVKTMRNVDGLLAWAGVSHDDIVWVDVNDSVENYQTVIDGRADIASGYPSALAMLEAEKNPCGLGWIDLNAEADPEGAKRFRNVDPQATFGPVYSGVASAIGIWGVTGINFEQTRSETDPSLVYNLAKWFDENYTRFKDTHPSNRFRNRETLMEGLRHTFLPCHEGLIEYLKDIGVWTPAHDIRQQENQELVNRYAAAYQECMFKADEKKIWVARESEEWLKLWNDYREANLREFTPFYDLPGVTA
ncbi:MAG: TAXI family TRAP transporter solute-binding subunit, partial [Dehalococcoidales bacterium]